MLSLLLVLQVFVPLQDSRYLKSVADSFGVPFAVVEAVAWMETRDGRRWNALGPGVVRDTVLPDGRVDSKRVCREVGRFQLRGCVDWVKLLQDHQCVYAKLRTVYRVGVHCGVRNLSRLYLIYGNWLEVIKRQNGGGPLAEKYRHSALAFISWRSLSDSSRTMSLLSR